MLKCRIQQQSHPAQTTRIPLHKPFLSGAGATASFPAQLNNPLATNNKQEGERRRISKSSVRHVTGGCATIKASLFPTTKKPPTTKVKAVVTVQSRVGGVPLLSDIDLLDLLNLKVFHLELVSAELDPNSGIEKETVESYARRTLSLDRDVIKLEAKFEVPADFGEVGAILVENKHRKAMFVKDIALDGLSISLNCDSWVQPDSVHSQKRVFFSNKSYTPSQTPSGLKTLREKELTLLRGDGQGQRKASDRIYDYDVYNDLGDPDKKDDLTRPVLGGEKHPYPRRCRTGRKPTKKDPLSESTAVLNYVPRDEAFSDVKGVQFSAKTVFSVTHAVIPTLEAFFTDKDGGFPDFDDINELFHEGIDISPPTGLLDILPRFAKGISSIGKSVFRFETPELIKNDKYSWLTDVEFARQTLSGLNPCSIQLVTELPFKSKLDPAVYGPPESGITKELVEKEIGGFMTIEEAIKNKKLFFLDYYDIFLPYVNKVRELKGRNLYGSRTIFFLTPSGTLRPLAIELARPPGNGKPQWKQVFQPSSDATGAWLWRLAKAHVLSHDSWYHQLVSHWLRTHCCTEPYVIAANRQLSAMHPIYRLLRPHFRYTMEINALARQVLINADGIIESTFSPGRYCIEMSSAVYGQLWQFNQESLPGDLLSRGIAEEDQNAEHGLKLAIEDYPFANDGLVLWDAIKQWVTDYVNHYYPEAVLVQSDQELQAWWHEVRTVGHADKKDEPWWPSLNTPQDLIEIASTIIWIASGHHAAVNFGQYDFGGYFPNRPTMARTSMPTENPTDESWKRFEESPADELLSCFPSKMQATKVMAILDVLSSHSPDEEYIGEKMEPSWEEEPTLKAAFERFNGRLKDLEGVIDARNADESLKNRTGAGVMPYKLLKPSSESGVTGRGVPNSISI